MGPSWSVSRYLKHRQIRLMYDNMGLIMGWQFPTFFASCHHLEWCVATTFVGSSAPNVDASLVVLPPWVPNVGAALAPGSDFVHYRGVWRFQPLRGGLVGLGCRLQWGPSGAWPRLRGGWPRHDAAHLLR